MDLKSKGLLVVLSGPSGCGKDTILSELKQSDSSIVQSISMTTRKMRDGEEDGVDYYFADVSTFEKNISDGYFLEYVKYGSNYYGTPKKAVDKLISQGNSVFLKIEVEGAGNIRRFYPDCVSIFIVPPSFKELKKRLLERGTETDESYLSRVKIAENEFNRAKEYDYIVINDDLTDCIAEIKKILGVERLKYARMKETLEDIINNK